MKCELKCIGKELKEASYQISKTEFITIIILSFGLIYLLNYIYMGLGMIMLIAYLLVYYEAYQKCKRWRIKHEIS